MKNWIWLIALFFTFGLQAKQPKIFVAGSGMNKIVLIDKESGKCEWEHPLNSKEECNSIVFTKSKELLYAYQKGAKLIRLDHSVVWDYPVESPNEVQSTTQLKNGDYMLGICGDPSRLVILDKQGKEKKTITFDTGIKNPHGQFRQVNETKSGDFILSLLGKKSVAIIDKTGKEVRRYPLETGAFCAMELPDGNIIVSCGDGHYFQEIDAKSGAEIKRVNALSSGLGDKLHYVAQIVRLNNGNLLQCNWNGHFKKGETRKVPHLIEYNKAGQVAWLYDQHDVVAKVSAVNYVEDGSKIKLNK